MLDFGTEEQKARVTCPAMLGRPASCGCSSCPSRSGGSDLAGLLTRADRDGDVFRPERLEDLEHRSPLL